MDDTEIISARLFNPVIADGQTTSDLIYPNLEAGVCHRLDHDHNEVTWQNGVLSPLIKDKTLIVSIQGSCKNNGETGSKASYGIYFGQDSPYNTSGLLPKGERQKSQSAQLFACQKAIEIVEDVISKKIEVKTLIIKTHSAYLVRCLSEYIWIWEENGYNNAAGKPVVNRVIIEKVQDLITRGAEDGRLKIKFWLVGRKDNAEAVPLAKEAFEAGDEIKREVKVKEEEEEAEGGGGPKVTLLEKRQEAWETAITYWTQIAPMEPAAQQLCQRLSIRLKKQKPGHFSGITAPIRRLVITGEDRAQNFERLFGPEWESAVRGEWMSLRFEILTKPAPGTHLYDMASMLDVGAPWVRPRVASEAERLKLERMEKIKVDLSMERMMDLLAIV